jgi:hypothetical protein
MFILRSYTVFGVFRFPQVVMSNADIKGIARDNAVRTISNNDILFIFPLSPTLDVRYKLELTIAV